MMPANVAHRSDGFIQGNQHLELTSKHAEEIIALDGSVDMKGRPVIKARTGGWKACAFIIGDEMSERLAYYGIAANLVTYLTTVLHEGLASAAKNTNLWVGVTTVVPLLGAFFADAYWGRYMTIAAVSVVYFLGLVFLTLAVSLPTLKPPPCGSDSSSCRNASSAQLGFFYFALYLISIGTGGIKPCLEAFGADQFDEEDPAEKKGKSSFFNWWYFGLCTGALTAITVLVYIQDNVSWGVGFGIPAIAMAVALCIFLCGTPFYRQKLPGGSPFTRVAQVFVAAVRKWNVSVPSNPSLLYEIIDSESLRVGRRRLTHTNDFIFLDKAATFNGFNNVKKEESESPWLLCTVTQVEEVKLLIRIVPVWLASLTYGVVLAQLSTMFTKQGGTLNAHFGPHFKIPPASLQSITIVVILVLLPLYDRVFVPIARRFTGIQRGITLLQRIGVGMFFSILCMVAAALTEQKRLKVAMSHGLLDKSHATASMSIFWLLPQYILMGMADLFGIVGQQEFFYDQVPDTMRTLGMALYLGASGVGNFLSSFYITVIDRVTRTGGHRSWFANDPTEGHLDYFYWLLAVLSTVNLCFFVVVASFYTYKKAESIAKSSNLHHCDADEGAAELGVSEKFLRHQQQKGGEEGTKVSAQAKIKNMS